MLLLLHIRSVVYLKVTIFLSPPTTARNRCNGRGGPICSTSSVIIDVNEKMHLREVDFFYRLEALLVKKITILSVRNCVPNLRSVTLRCSELNAKCVTPKSVRDHKFLKNSRVMTGLYMGT